MCNENQKEIIKNSPYEEFFGIIPLRSFIININIMGTENSSELQSDFRAPETNATPSAVDSLGVGFAENYNKINSLEERIVKAGRKLRKGQQPTIEIIGLNRSLEVREDIDTKLKNEKEFRVALLGISRFRTESNPVINYLKQNEKWRPVYAQVGRAAERMDLPELKKSLADLLSIATALAKEVPKKSSLRGLGSTSMI